MTQGPSQQEPRTVTGNRYLAEALAAYGISHVFMVPTMSVPALAEMTNVGITGIMTHGEKAAAYMADGYARASGRPGVCFAQAIGSTNLAAGLRDASFGGSPVVAITGGPEGRTRYRDLYQELEDFPVWGPITKSNVRLDEVRRLPDMLRQAFRVATSGAPGPVHIEVSGYAGASLYKAFPLDASTGPMAEPQFGSVPASRPVADAALVRRAIELLVGAERPVIVAGGGARMSGCHAELLAVAEALHVPVATSLSAKGLLDERHELSVGVVGASSRPSANRTLAAADLVFFVGCRAGGQVTDGWRLPKTGTPVVQLDIDGAELGRNYPNAVSLPGDAKATLAAMLGACVADDAGAAGSNRRAWTVEVAGYVREWRASVEGVLTSTEHPIRPERLCAAVTRCLPSDGALVVDTGHSGIWTAEFVDLAPTQLFLRANGSLGWGFPASMGVRCALPAKRPVVCFTGDGGFYYHLAEIETMARHGLNVTVVVNDNRSLSQDMKIFDSAFKDSDLEAGRRMWMFGDVDLAAVARGLGCDGVRVDKADELDEKLRTAIESPRPTVVVVRTDYKVLPPTPFGGRDFYS